MTAQPTILINMNRGDYLSMNETEGWEAIDKAVEKSRELGATRRIRGKKTNMNPTDIKTMLGAITALNSKVDAMGIRNMSINKQVAQIEEPFCEQCSNIGHTSDQCPSLILQEQACSTYGHPYARNHLGF